MKIHFAQTSDIPRLMELLTQVLELHARGRADIFKTGTTKYSPSELADMIADDERPLFVIEDESKTVQGYAMCEMHHIDAQNMVPMKELYIDDLCVDQSCRKNHYGKALYEAVKDYAKRQGVYHITLNVWACNPDAMAFYEHIGLSMMKQTMEEIL